MRAADLVAKNVRDSSGRLVGRVNDIRVVADGRKLGDFGKALRIHGLIVSKRHTGSYLGYERSDLGGPWLLAKLFRWLHRDAVYVPWAAVRAVEDDVIRLDVTYAKLPGVPLI